MYGVLGEPVVLNCSVPGSQELEFRWNNDVSSLILELPSYSEYDSGTYSCTVRSKYDECGRDPVEVAHFNVITAGKCVIVQ